MKNRLEEVLSGLPEDPGVYKMLDVNGRIIYIGKSKCLKKRVNSYFVSEPKWEKAKKMRPFIVDLEYEVTDTHLEAMLLECRLIKSQKPYFNVMMKNDERYVFLSVGEDIRKSPLLITREREGISFGPLRRKGPVEEMIGNFRNLYPLEKRRGRYLFDYHVLPEKMDSKAFCANQKILAELFSDSKALQRFIGTLDREMERMARDQKFERAVRYRDLRDTLTYLCRCLHKFEIFRDQELLYQVPIRDGWKVFYIRKGLVVDAQRMASISGKEREDFLLKAREKEAVALFSEKGSMDYKDILFAELENSPEEFITIL